MTLTARQRRALDSIEQHLGDREPRLASMFAMFSKLAKDESPPTTETVQVRRWHWLTEPIARSCRHHRRRRRHARANNGAAARLVNVAFVPFLVLGLLVTVVVMGGHGSANTCSQVAGYHPVGVAKLATAKCAP